MKKINADANNSNNSVCTTTTTTATITKDISKSNQALNEFQEFNCQKDNCDKHEQAREHQLWLVADMVGVCVCELLCKDIGILRNGNFSNAFKFVANKKNFNWIVWLSTEENGKHEECNFQVKWFVSNDKQLNLKFLLLFKRAWRQEEKKSRRKQNNDYLAINVLNKLIWEGKV